MREEDEPGNRHVRVLCLAPLRSAQELDCIYCHLHTLASLSLYVEEEEEREGRKSTGNHEEE